ncbi:MAG: SMP-30/gluconolactonase/LRE family protein [Verrucomicrobiota bacterium JB022]|nr:SMP-30/gluconolactonase/LRE family protein [Verrucomicrobiota bacterium JB022]
MKAENVLHAQACLGEGPIWWHEHLLWIDVERGELHRFNPQTGIDTQLPCGEKIGTVVPRAGDSRVIVAKTTGLVAFDLQTGQQEALPSPARHLLGDRFNDGKCDPRGRLFVGTTSEEPGDEGQARLFRFDGDGSFREVLGGLTISNGVCWDAERGLFFFIDTPTGRIDLFDYDVQTGDIANRRPLLQVPEDWGHPDGMTRDAEGNLWVAFYAGGAVRCIDSHRGTLLAEVRLPVPHVTACAFGGEGLRTLYITTGSRDVKDRAALPEAGDLFACEPGVAGEPAVPFAG